MWVYHLAEDRWVWMETDADSRVTVFEPEGGAKGAAHPRFGDRDLGGR